MNSKHPHLILYTVFFVLLLLAACQTAVTNPQPTAVPQDIPPVDAVVIDTPEGSTEIINEPEIDEIQAESGLTRLSPYPMGTLITLNGWQIEVRDLLRGEDAIAVLQANGRSVDPPEDGSEYVLAKVFLRCVALDNSAHSIGISEMAITGSSHLIYGDQLDGLPQPEFLFEDMFTAEKVEGWVDAILPVEETDLMLVVDLDSWDAENRATRFFALEEGASLSIPAAATENSINDMGLTPQTAAGIGDQIVMKNWEIVMVDSIRGQEAYDLILSGDPQYAAPENDWEYVLLQVQARYRSLEDHPAFASSSDFYAANEDGDKLMIGPSYIYRPKGLDLVWFNQRVLPGAFVEGWVIVASPSGAETSLLAYDPDGYSYDSSGESKRYFVIP